MLIYLLLSKSAPIASLGMPQLTFSEVCLVPCGAMVGFQLVQFVPKVRLHSLALLMAWPGFVHMGWAKPGTPPAPIHKTDSTIPFSRGQEWGGCHQAQHQGRGWPWVCFVAQVYYEIRSCWAWKSHCSHRVLRWNLHDPLINHQTHPTGVCRLVESKKKKVFLMPRSDLWLLGFGQHIQIHPYGGQLQH